MTSVLTVPVVDLPAAGRAVHAPTRTPRGRTGLTVFALMTTLTLAATLARNTWVFTRKVYEHGDYALNSILVQNSHHELLLTGPVSRVGFSHPGPVYMYVLAGGQALFHDWLPLTASAYGAQFIGDAILQAVLLGLVVRTSYRLTASLPATAVAGGIVFWFAADHEMLGQTWLPNLYITAFALLIISAIALCYGRSTEITPFVFASGLLVHGHVAFIMFVGVTWLVAGLGWLLAHRTGRADELRKHRRNLGWAGAVLLIFLAPMVAEVVLHYPGPWPKYVNYDGAAGGHDDAESLAFFGHFWSISYPVSLAIVAAFGAIAALLLEQNRDRMRLFLRGYLILGLETALFFFYVMQGIDKLAPINYYTGWFYQTVPMFLLVLPAVHLTLLAQDSLARPRLLARAIGVGVVALLAAGAVTPTLTEANPDNPAVPKFIAALTADPDRHGRPIVLRFAHDEWSFMAAALVEGRRTGIQMCVADPYWAGLFTETSMCPNPTGHFAVASINTKDYHGGKKVIWSDQNHVVFEGTVPNMAPGSN